MFVAILIANISRRQIKHKVVAFKLLQSGMSCSEISKITGLSKEEIKDLDNSHECNH